MPMFYEASGDATQQSWGPGDELIAHLFLP